MTIRQILGSKFLEEHLFVDENVRTQFERTPYVDIEEARSALKRCLPQHSVMTEGDRIVVSTHDRAIRIAEFRMGSDSMSDQIF